MENQQVCLVIENDDDIGLLITVVLSSAGFEVHAVRSGSYGIAAAASGSSPSSIILDMALPDMDSHDVARALQASSAAPVLFLIGESDQDGFLAAMTSGTAAYLAKPFSPAALRETAKRLVPLPERP
jgi:two-component system OmpR family response regulator